MLGGRNGKQLTETKNECIKAGLKLNQVSYHIFITCVNFTCVVIIMSIIKVLWVIGDIADVQVQQQLINTAINSFNQLDVLVDYKN